MIAFRDQDPNLIQRHHFFTSTLYEIQSTQPHNVSIEILHGDQGEGGTDGSPGRPFGRSSGYDCRISRRDKGFPGEAGLHGDTHGTGLTEVKTTGQLSVQYDFVGGVGSTHSNHSIESVAVDIWTDCGRFDNLQAALFFLFCGDCLGYRSIDYCMWIHTYQ